MSHRVNITLPDDVYLALKEYAAVNNSQPTTIARDLLIEMMPSFIAVTKAAKEAQNSKKTALMSLQSVLIDGIHNASGISSELQKELNS